jgi:YVTN family beta-propeller protein
VKAVGVAVAPDGRAIFVTTSHANGVDVVDPARREVVATIPVGHRPWGIALSPDGDRLYTANGLSNDVSIVDVAARRSLGTVPAGEAPWGVAIAR